MRKIRKLIITRILIAVLAGVGIIVFIKILPRMYAKTEETSVTVIAEGSGVSDEYTNVSKEPAGIDEKKSSSVSDVSSSSELGEDVKEDDGSGSGGGTFSLTMLNVGQGLSILISCEDEEGWHYLLYDGGNRDASSYVVSYLNSQGITYLEDIIVSHYDEDHVAGVVGCLNVYSAGCVYDPDYEADTKIYQSYIEKLSANGAKRRHPSVGESFSLGDAEVTFIAPASYEAEDENNLSLVVRIVYGETSYIITGDAEEEEEEEMLSSGCVLKSDLYVVGHHGSSSSSSSSFVNAVAPSYAFISCGEGNDYGHPTKKTLNTLKGICEGIFRSDKQGEVTAYSDGKTIRFSTEPTDDMTPGVYNMS